MRSWMLVFTLCVTGCCAGSGGPSEGSSRPDDQEKAQKRDPQKAQGDVPLENFPVEKVRTNVALENVPVEMHLSPLAASAAPVWSWTATLYEEKTRLDVGKTISAFIPIPFFHLGKRTRFTLHWKVRPDAKRVGDSWSWQYGITIYPPPPAGSRQIYMYNLKEDPKEDVHTIEYVSSPLRTVQVFLVGTQVYGTPAPALLIEPGMNLTAEVYDP